MEVTESLLGLRLAGMVFGLFMALWTFVRYRASRCDRGEFLLTLFMALGMVAVAINPNLGNVLADIFSLKNQQLGRIITLIIVANILFWILLIKTRERSFKANRQFDLLVRRLASDKFFETYAGTNFDIIVIIPALNEGENLEHVLPRMPSVIQGNRCGCLVVDDGSSDETPIVVTNSGHMLISGLINRGGGSALRLGYDIAQKLGAQIVVTMDADGQHLPEEIEGLVSPILSGKEDIVIGSRLMGSREKDSVIRLVGIHFFNHLINLLANTRISDCSNGFRAFRMNALAKVLLTQDQFHTAELIIDAARKGMKIGEAPVTVLKRISGESKKGKNLSYGFNFCKTIFSTWLRK